MPGRKNPHIEDAIGQVKFFLASKGYGFIQVFEPEEVDKDIFFHISEYKADIVAENSWMKFDILRTDNGLKAVNMRRVNQPPEHKLFGTSFNY